MPTLNPFEKSWVPWYSQSNNAAGLEKDTRAVTKHAAWMLVAVLSLTVLVIFVYFDKVSPMSKVISFLGLFTVAWGLRMIAYRSETRKITELRYIGTEDAKQQFIGTATNQVTPESEQS
jgi:hypothetical protein